MDDLQQIFNNLDPDARDCIECVLERMAMAQVMKHTMKMVLEMNFDQGSIVDSQWKEQMAGARRRVRSKGL